MLLKHKVNASCKMHLAFKSIFLLELLLFNRNIIENSLKIYFESLEISI